jgi:hypothetical protein
VKHTTDNADLVVGSLTIRFPVHGRPKVFVQAQYLDQQEALQAIADQLLESTVEWPEEQRPRRPA